MYFTILMIFLNRIDKDLTYDNLASGLKLALEKDKSALDADRLKNYTGTVSLFLCKRSYNSQ